MVEKISPNLSLERRGIRLLLSLSFLRRGAAGGEVGRDVKTPLLNLNEVWTLFYFPGFRLELIGDLKVSQSAKKEQFSTTQT